MAKIAMISLGCEKNLINSEQMLWLLTNAGHETVPLEEAEICIINTCGFIESAKAEAIENILQVASLRESGQDIKIIVAGCMAQRYPDDILAELPEVDAVVGCGSFGEISAAVESVEKGERPKLLGDINAPLDETPRVVTTPSHYSYLKISDGCDNHCAYCVIPSIRGKYRSRTMENIVAEAEKLAQSGTKELILIAQDVTRYGIDLYGKRSLTVLLKKLCLINGIQWIRLHYLYPHELDDELIDLMAAEDKIVKYFDIPIQHINTRILKAMNRRDTKEEIQSLIKKIRAKIPDAVIRTSIICGLPGEGEEEFDELCTFLKEYRLERAGFFVFSPEEGTKAAQMEDQVPKDVAERRAEMLTGIQTGIMEEAAQRLIGKKVQVICDGIDPVTGRCVCRSAGESPEIDGVIFVDDCTSAQRGDMFDIIIESSFSGEIVGRTAAKESIK